MSSCYQVPLLLPVAVTAHEPHWHSSSTCGLRSIAASSFDVAPVLCACSRRMSSSPHFPFLGTVVAHSPPSHSPMAPQHAPAEMMERMMRMMQEQQRRMDEQHRQQQEQQRQQREEFQAMLASMGTAAPGGSVSSISAVNCNVNFGAAHTLRHTGGRSGAIRAVSRSRGPQCGADAPV